MTIHLTGFWSDELPTEPGCYWRVFMEPEYDDEGRPRMVEIRDIDRKLYVYYMGDADGIPLDHPDWKGCLWRHVITPRVTYED